LQLEARFDFIGIANRTASQNSAQFIFVHVPTGIADGGLERP